MPHGCQFAGDIALGEVCVEAERSLILARMLPRHPRIFSDHLQHIFILRQVSHAASELSLNPDFLPLRLLYLPKLSLFGLGVEQVKKVVVERIVNQVAQLSLFERLDP